MRKKILASLLSAAFLFSAAPQASLARQTREADLTWMLEEGQTFGVQDEAPGTVYEILTPGMAHISAHENNNTDFRMDRKGDVYILAHEPGGREFLYYFIVGGEENRTVIEHQVEHRTHHVNVVFEDENENPANFAERVLELVNQERAQRGIAPLRLSRELMDAAAIRADEITQVFSHTRPNGQSCNSMISNGAYTVGENIAAGSSTPEATVEQWMNSPGHRANILGSDYTELGVGYAYRPNSEYRWYWVQMFRRPMSRAIRRW